MTKVAILCQDGHIARSLGNSLAVHFEMEYGELSGYAGTADLAVVQINEIALTDEHRAFLSEISARKKVVLITRWSSFDQYIAFFDTGISAILPLPCEAHNLLAIVSIVLEAPFSEIAVTAGRIKFKYEGKHFDISFSPERMLTLMLVCAKTNMLLSSMTSNLVNNRHTNRIVYSDVTSGVSADYKLEQDLLEAAARNDFVLYYQPVCNLNTSQPGGFEALIRWRRGGAIIPPDEFIPTAERTNAIFPITRWTFNRAMSDLRYWLDHFEGLAQFRVTINLSARLFEDESIADYIITKTKEYSLSPDNIGIEITESALLRSMESANLILLKLKAASFTLYMDDFGTGYSSLTYLKHFPVDIIKIDKSFVKWLCVDEESEHIVRSILGLAHGLNLSVVGEGVEEEDHLNFLRDNGCEYGQGYYFSKPLPFDSATEYLEKNLYKRTGDN